MVIIAPAMPITAERIALAAAEAASAETMKYYRGAFEVELKEDQTPVTVADRRAEDIIRDRLLGAFPEHGFFGEESGRRQADAEYLWLVDPIDGTKSFVGGYGMWSTQIALMHREIVEENGWLTERQFLNALSFCMLLPGPEAMQLATYAGWRLHGVAGGLAAGLAFVLPGAAVVLALVRFA